MNNADPIERSYPSPAALHAQIVLLMQQRDEALARTGYVAAKLAAAERTVEVLRDTNGKLRGRLDAALLARDEARESRDAALKQRDALEGIVSSLHERAVRATEALGVVYGPADAE